MASRFLALLPMFTVALGGDVTVSVTDCCLGASPPCKGTISKLNFPAVAQSPGVIKSNGTGTLTVATSAPKMELAITLGSAKVLDKTVSACGPMHIDLPLGLGTVDVTAITCPAQPGPVTVNIEITNKIALPGATKSHSVTKDENGNTLLCLDIDIAPKKSVHPERVAMIKEIENSPGIMWKAAAHPRFASQAPGASKSLCGVKGDPKVAVDAAVARGEIVRVSEDANVDIPESFDSEANWPHCAKIINDIRDQSNCGCCWAFGGIEAASDRMCIATNASLMLPLSAQDVCFNANRNGCGGGQINTPWSYVKNSGAVTGGQYQGSGSFGSGLCSSFSLPHCHHHGPQGADPYPAEGQPGCPSESSPRGPTKCDAGAKSPHDGFQDDKYTYTGQTITARGEAGIQQAIMAGGPVETAFTVYSDFENYASGIYHHVSGSMAGGHAVKFVGWGVENGQKYWKVANSWNPYWGEKGYFRIVRGTNEGGIENQIVASSPTAKWGKKALEPASVVV